MTKSFKIKKRQQRHRRVRTKIIGTSKQPRLCVFRSNQHVYAQLIDDSTGKIILAISDHELKKVTAKETKATSKSKRTSKKVLPTKQDKAYRVGRLMAEQIISQKIGSQVVFDRAGYKYHGRVRALAEGARDGGLKF